nr:hypothetical protein Itr_chr14CG03920 [Ipomoea trifida]
MAAEDEDDIGQKDEVAQPTCRISGYLAMLTECEDLQRGYATPGFQEIALGEELKLWGRRRVVRAQHVYISILKHMEDGASESTIIAAHSSSLLAASRIGGAHLKRVSPSGISSAAKAR